jgi:hypothetical protein
MPTISATFFEIIIYTVPGFVVLYGVRHQSTYVKNLFEAVPEKGGIPTLVALLVLALALGIAVSGIASLYVPFVSRLTTRLRTLPIPRLRAHLGKCEKRHPKWRSILHFIDERLEAHWGKEVIYLNKLDFARIYRGPEPSVRMFMHHSWNFQAYSNMATAWLISLGVFLWNLRFGPDVIENWQFKLFMLIFLHLGMLLAAQKYFRIIYHIGKQLSAPPSERIGTVGEA